MTQQELWDITEMFWNNGVDPIFSFWDESTEHKRLLFASHDEAAVNRFILTWPGATEQQKANAQQALDNLTSEDDFIPAPL